MADTLDIIDEATALTAINRATPPDGLQQMITAVSRIVDSIVGPVVVRTVTAEVHAGGGEEVYLRRHPVTSVTLVREIQAPGTVATLSAVAWGAATDGYYAPVDPDAAPLLSGIVARLSSGAATCWPTGDYSVEVTYEAGRYATTAAVDARFAFAMGAVLRRLWKREAGAWSQTPAFLETADADPGQGFYKAVAPIVAELLADEVQHPRRGVA